MVLGGVSASLYYVYLYYWAYVLLACLGLLGLFILYTIYKLYRRFGSLVFGGVPYAMDGQNIVDYANKYFGGDNEELLRKCASLHYYRKGKSADLFANMETHLEKIRDALFNPANPAYSPVDMGRLPESVRQALLPDFLGMYGKGWRYKVDLNWSGDRAAKNDATIWYFRAIGQAPILDNWHKRFKEINAIIGRDVRYCLSKEGTGVFVFDMQLEWSSPYDDEFEEMGFDIREGAQTWPNLKAKVEAAQKLFGEMPQEEFIAPDEALPFVEKPANEGGHLHNGYIFLGTNIRDGKPYWKKIQDFQHHLIVGISGYGKSVFLNQVLQGIRHNPEYFETVYLVDLKGGVELVEYEDISNQFKVKFRYEELHELVQELVDTMNQRLDWMRENRVKKWTGKRILFMVDEFAQIALQSPETKEEKAAHYKLLANLNKLSMLGRGAGVLLWIQLQKATTDMMDSSFRNNLQAQVCFRVASRLAAASLFGEAKDLEIDPTRLRRGQCIYYDDATGETVYLQGHMRQE